MMEWEVAKIQAEAEEQARKPETKPEVAAEEKMGPNFKVAGKVEKSVEEMLRGAMKHFLHEGHLSSLTDQKLVEFLEHEIPKTYGETELVKMANEETNRIIQGLGLKAYDIPERNVHILEKEYYTKVTKKIGSCFAVVRPELQGVLLKEAELQKNDLYFATAVLHEFIHLKSYLAYDIKVERDAEKKIKGFKAHRYREGVSVYSPIKKSDESGERTFFVGLNEAITSRQEKIYLQKIVKDPRFSKEWDQLSPEKVAEMVCILKEQDRAGEDKMNRSNPETERFLDENEILRFNPKTKQFIFVGYKYQREVLGYLCQAVAEDREQTAEDIHNVFLKSHFTGNILPIARLVEDSFGKGSFRRLGTMHIDKESALKTLAELKKRRSNKIP